MELINADSSCAQTTAGFAFISVHSRLFSFVFFVCFVDNLILWFRPKAGLGLSVDNPFRRSSPGTSGFQGFVIVWYIVTIWKIDN